MFQVLDLLVRISFFFFLAAQCLTAPLEDGDNPRLLQVRQVAVVATGSGYGILGWANETPTSSASAAATATEAVEVSQISVTIVQPSLCTASDFQYSTKTAIPTGQVLILPDQTAYWGATGSIWNFTLDDRVEFSSLTASCQGSICTGSQAEMSGSIVKNRDGVWTLNVTADMQQAIIVSGVTSGGDLVNGKFDLTITSTPPCALPIAESCTSGSFNISASQWQAYSTDLWLANYVDTNNIQTFSDLYNMVTTEFLEEPQYSDLVCGFGNADYACEPPLVPTEDCNSTQALLVIWGVMRINNALNFVWGILTVVEGDIGLWISSLIANWVVPSVTQKWESIVTAVSSIVGVLVFIFILIDALTAGEASPAVSTATGIAVALIVGTTNIIGGVANFANGFTTEPPSDTYLEYVGNYDNFDTAWNGYMQTATQNLWSPSNANFTSFGTTAVKNGLNDGAWTNFINPVGTANLAVVARNFFDTIILDAMINNIWKINGYYVVFVPYGEVSFEISPGGGTAGTTTFELDQCNDIWLNDDAKENYVSCSLNYGGTPGMTILTQPSSVGGTAKDVLDNYTQPVINYTFTNDVALQSSLTANAEYGFNYNISTLQLNDTVRSGDYNLTAEFVIPSDAAGLFNLESCVLTDMSFVPGARKFLDAGYGNTEWLTFSDPCICMEFTSHGMKFSDYATAAVVTSVEGNGSCYANYVPKLSPPEPFPV